MVRLRWYFILCLTLSLLLAGCAGEATTTAPTASEVVSTQPAPTTEPATEPPTATEPPAPTEAAMPEMPSPAAAESIRAAMRAQLTGGPYHVQSTVISDGSTFQMSADVVPPDQLHSRLDLDGTTTQILISGGQMWSDHGEGWSEPVSGQMVLSTLEQIMTNPDGAGIAITNEEFGGADAVNGKPTWVFIYTQTFAEMDVVSEVHLWVEIATGLPLKLESTGEAFGSTSTTTQEITYDDSITITPPQ